MWMQTTQGAVMLAVAWDFQKQATAIVMWSVTSMVTAAVMSCRPVKVRATPAQPPQLLQ